MKALEIDEANAEAHLALAMELHWYERNWTASEQEYQRAIALNPKSPDAACLYSWLLVPLGRKDEAERISGEAQHLDPLSQIGNFTPGSISVFTRQWDRAVGQLRAAVDLDATYWLDHVFLGRAYEQKHDFPDAIAAFEQALKIDQDHAEIWSALGHVYGVSGNTAEARKILGKLQTPGSSQLCCALQRCGGIRGTRRRLAVLRLAGARFRAAFLLPSNLLCHRCAARQFAHRSPFHRFEASSKPA